MNRKAKLIINVISAIMALFVSFTFGFNFGVDRTEKHIGTQVEIADNIISSLKKQLEEKDQQLQQFALSAQTATAIIKSYDQKVDSFLNGGDVVVRRRPGIMVQSDGTIYKGGQR